MGKKKKTADTPLFPSPIASYYFPFTSSGRFHPSRHQSYEKKVLLHHWRVFGLCLWNTNVDPVIHGNHTSDKTKGWTIMSPESLKVKYKLKILLMEHFFSLLLLWGGFKKLSTAVSHISRNIMYSLTTRSEELGIFRSLHKDKCIFFHRTGGHSAFKTCSYHNFSQKNFLN